MHGPDHTDDKKPLTWVEERKKVVYHKPNPVKKSIVLQLISMVTVNPVKVPWTAQIGGRIMIFL